MSEADKALAEVRRWLCDNLDASDAGHVCGMLSVVSRRVVRADELESENAKLRELVRHMGACIQDSVNEDEQCVFCPYQSVEYDCEFESRMQELGIEVSE